MSWRDLTLAVPDFGTLCLEQARTGSEIGARACRDGIHSMSLLLTGPASEPRDQGDLTSVCRLRSRV